MADVKVTGEALVGAVPAYCAGCGRPLYGMEVCRCVDLLDLLDGRGAE